ncbi:carbohydrate sulfotransferase 11-like [Periplaneta americana]|uniref:carbohydrate sulfotransferase 11-like n=1 Tax=Periplaneta americana TaxID=6978 RepID=UPI0037E710F5
MTKLKAAVVIARRKTQNAGLMRCLIFISMLCVIVTFILLVPCQTNILAVFVNNGSLELENMSNGSLELDNISQFEEALVQDDNEYILTDAEMEAITLKMKERQLIIMDECHDSGRFKVKNILKKSRLIRVVKKLFIDKKRKLAWCPVYKAGSTTWMEIFATMGGVMTPENRKRLNKGLIQMNQLARTAYPKITNVKQTVEFLPETTRFIIVRHPFERLLSAYRDKLEHRKGREFYFRRYGRFIVRSQRDTNSTSLEKVEPTFVEFLRYLAKTKSFDEHWRPFTSECAPCELDYQIILKMENIEMEELYLATKFKLLEFLPMINSTRQWVHNRNPKGRTELKYAKKYYSEVPRQLLQEIYMLYEQDFRLFGYSPQEYFDFTKQKA